MSRQDLWSQFSHDPRAASYAPMRASDADREVVLRALGEAYADGRLDAGELDDRTTAVQHARTLGELPVHLADLVPAADRVSAVPVVAPLTASSVEEQAAARWRRHRDGALRVWLLVSAICWTIWLLTDFGGHPWPVYPMLGTAVPLVGTLVRRRDIVDSERAAIVARHEKAVAKAERRRLAAEAQRRAELEPPDEKPGG